MILGMSTAVYTLLHVVISLIGIVSGLIVMYGFLEGKRFDSLTALFLTTTALTSITGFAFPSDHLTPAQILGILSLVILALAIPARYFFHMSGIWRAVYVVGSATALYLNLFVLVVQSFEKIPVLHALAPTQKEAPFVVAQLLLLTISVWFSVVAVKRFKPQPSHAAI